MEKMGTFFFPFLSGIRQEAAGLTCSKISVRSCRKILKVSVTSSQVLHWTCAINPTSGGMVNNTDISLTN